jgi:peptidoglycan/xylan/chitin deacetylase (PgdA/CDA1 family)
VRVTSDAFTNVLKEPLRLPTAVVLERRLRRAPLRLGLVIVYHRTAPRRGNVFTEIDPGTSTSELRRQLELLEAHFRVVRADEVVDAASSRVPGQRFPVAITFDDDLSSHLEHATPVLESLRLPATFFLTGASLDGPHPQWWDDLQRAVDARRIDAPALPEVEPQLLRSALNGHPGALQETMWTIASLPPRRRDDVAARLRNLDVPGGDRGLSAADVRALCQGGRTIGFHTLRHYDLTTLDDYSLEVAMHEGRERLAEVVGEEMTLIAYPHGFADERVANAASTGGFRLGFTTTARPVHHDDNPLLIGRIGPTLRSPRAFAVQVVKELRAAQQLLDPRSRLQSQGHR